MIFTGISKTFSLINEEQYDTIGAFYDEMAELYGLDNLVGLGYGWSGGTMEYAIGLESGEIPGANFRISLPDSGWITTTGRTDDLKRIYDEIYRDGALTYEIESFTEGGDCTIKYYRNKSAR